MTQATALNSSGTGFAVTNSVLNSAGTSFDVNNDVLDVDSNAFTIFLALTDCRALNSSGTSFLVGYTVLDSDGNSFEVLGTVLSSDGTEYLYCTSAPTEPSVAEEFGGANTPYPFVMTRELREEDELLMRFAREYMKH